MNEWISASLSALIDVDIHCGSLSPERHAAVMCKSSRNRLQVNKTDHLFKKNDKNPLRWNEKLVFVDWFICE